MANGHRGKRGKGQKKGRKQGGLWKGLPGDGDWTEWEAHLASRRRPVSLAGLVRRRSTYPLKWALPDGYEQTSRPRLLKQLSRLASKKSAPAKEVVARLTPWLEETAACEADSLFALECLGWAHALPRLAREIPAEPWRRMVKQLCDVAEAAAGLDLNESPLTQQLLHGELHLTLTYLFPEFKKFHAYQAVASRTLTAGTIELLDGEGLLHARHLDQTRSLLACWTRCALMSDAAGWSCFDDDARNQYEWMIQQTLRLTRADGTLVFSQGLSGDWDSDLFTAMLEQGNDPGEREIARLVLPGTREKPPGRRPRKLPEPPVHSEWAETCVMRCKWSRKSPQFAVTFHDRKLRTELAAAGRVLWSGDCTPRIHVDDQLLAIRSGWEELCWFTDDDVDYLELESHYEGSWRVQRQMLLARNGHFFLMADAVLGPRRQAVRYDLRLPLADDVRFEHDEPTRDGVMEAERRLATVMPLALAEWQCAPAIGSLTSDGGYLHLAQSGMVRRLYAPLFFDVNPRRLREKRTWRQLTVAQQLVIQSPETVVGYRVQTGRANWLIYRSLADRCNRSVLGQNLSHEFVAAKVDFDGRLEELIEIE